MGKSKVVSIEFKSSEKAYKLLQLIDPTDYIALNDRNYLIEIAPEDYDSQANFEEKRFEVMVELKKALFELFDCKVVIKKGSKNLGGFNLISMHAQNSMSDSVFFSPTDVGVKWLEANRMFFNDQKLEQTQKKYHLFKPQFDLITPLDLLKMEL